MDNNNSISAAEMLRLRRPQLGSSPPARHPAATPHSMDDDDDEEEQASPVCMICGRRWWKRCWPRCLCNILMASTPRIHPRRHHAPRPCSSMTTTTTLRVLVIITGPDS